MKKKQIMTILALSVVLLGSQVQNTYGTDEIISDQGTVQTATTEASDVIVAEEPEIVVEPEIQVVEPEESFEEEIPEEETEDEGQEDSEEENSEEESEEEDSEEENSEEESEEEEGDSEEEKSEESEDEGQEDSEEEASKEDDSKEDGLKEEDVEKTDSKKDNTDKIETEKPSKGDTSKKDVSPKKDTVSVDTQTTADTSTSNKTKPFGGTAATVSDSKNTALNKQVKTYIDQSYTPSESFVSWCDRVKYSVDTPIEGLPSFINQEMVVGALKSQDEYGIPASVTIAQIIQESGFGRYGEGGEKGQGLSYLAYGYNNLFGVKGTGTAGSVQLKTGEQNKDGSRYTITAGFRVYYTYTEAIEDRAELLTNYYCDLTDGVQDANTYAMRIGSRWATSILYGQHLIQNMERYDLYRLDKMTLQEYSELVGSFINPCPGSTMTDGFGYRDVPIAGATAYHKGIDLGTGAYNLPTYAVKEGVVTYAGYDSGAGNLIIIDHGDGLVTKYMHHKEIYVEVGDEVVQGQQIGLSGTTGVSTGNHLHFQVEENGIAVNPASYFEE